MKVSMNEIFFHGQSYGEYIAIFYVFKGWHITWSGIGKIASGVLAAYLITTHELPRQAFNDFFFDLEDANTMALLFTSLMVVVVCSCVDNIVTRMLKKILNFGKTG